MDEHDIDLASATGASTAEAISSPTGGDCRPLGERIGFIGLGRTGRVMAGHLAGGGCRVTGYDRRLESGPELQEDGIDPAVKITDLFDCGFVISMLPDDAAVREIVFGYPGHDGLCSGLRPGAVHLSMSTISPNAAAEFAEAHRKSGQCYVAAPVFGNPDAAKARELFIIAAGAREPVYRCRPIFDMLGQRTFVVGSDPGSANLVKLAGNVMIAATLQIFGEVLALVRKSDLDPKSFFDILSATMFDGRVHRIYGAKIVEQRYAPPGLAFPLALKDVRLALEHAEAAGFPMPSVSVVRDRLITGMARGYAGFDWSALGLVAAEDAGLDS